MYVAGLECLVDAHVPQATVGLDSVLKLSVFHRDERIVFEEGNGSQEFKEHPLESPMPLGRRADKGRSLDQLVAQLHQLISEHTERFGPVVSLLGKVVLDEPSREHRVLLLQECQHGAAPGPTAHD